MPYIRKPGIKGRFYVSDKPAGKKKHPCRDCCQCQWCSDERCELCLGSSCKKIKDKEKK